MREHLLRRRVVFRGRVVNFEVDTVRLPNGKTATREFVDHPGAVAVLPFLDPETVVLVRQFRHPVGAVTYEIPAGKLSPGEGRLACLRRELKEETGYTARRIFPLLDYWPSSAFSNELIRLYWAKSLAPGRLSPDEDEFIAAETVPYREVLAWVRSGKIKDSKTVIAVLAYDLLIRNRV